MGSLAVGSYLSGATDFTLLRSRLGGCSVRVAWVRWMAERYCTPREFANVAGISLATAYNMMAAGEVAFVKRSRGRLISERDALRVRGSRKKVDRPVFDRTAMDTDARRACLAARKSAPNGAGDAEAPRVLAMRVNRGGKTWTW